MRMTLPPLAASLLIGAAGLAGAATAEDRDYCERQQGSARVVCLRELDRAPSGSAAPAAATTAPVPAPATSPATPAPAAAPAPTSGPAPAPQAGGSPPYQVQGGNLVDATTYKGFQTWRAAACDRCHGANQQGLVGPSLIESLKRLTPAEFKTTVLNGRLDKGMPSFAASPTVSANIDALYAYLKGRSDGAITQAHVKPANGGG